MDPESDAHGLFLGVGSGDQPYIWEAEAGDWSGTSDAYATDAAFYPGTGNTGWKNSGTNLATGTFDTSRCRPGRYLLLARAATNNVAYEGTVTCAESGESAATSLTTPEWLALGVVSLPTRRTIPGTAADLTITLVSDNASGECKLDRLMAIPMETGGAAWYHSATTPTDVASRVDVDSDGTVLVDGSMDASKCKPGRLVASSRDRLIVCSEEAASDEATHLVNLAVLHRPRFDLWR